MLLKLSSAGSGSVEHAMHRLAVPPTHDPDAHAQPMHAKACIA